MVDKSHKNNYNIIIRYIQFEWDNHKAEINIQKHGITFDEASTVFADEYGLLIEDINHSETEERFILMGMSSTSKTLVVCHCYRGENEDVIRIISARKATKNEERQYNENRYN